MVHDEVTRRRAALYQRASAAADKIVEIRKRSPWTAYGERQKAADLAAATQEYNACMAEYNALISAIDNRLSQLG